jgi:hypothetical protein
MEWWNVGIMECWGVVARKLDLESRGTPPVD